MQIEIAIYRIISILKLLGFRSSSLGSCLLNRNIITVNTIPYLSFRDCFCDLCVKLALDGYSMQKSDSRIDDPKKLS